MAFQMDITSANATGVLIVENLFPAGIILDMFGSDQSIAQDSVQIAETRIGVDGHMVAGYTPVIYPVTLTFEPPALAARSLGELWAATTARKGIFACTLTFTIPSITKIYTWSRGVLQSGTPFPTNRKILDPTTWVFHFERLDIMGF